MPPITSPNRRKVLQIGAGLGASAMLLNGCKNVAGPAKNFDDLSPKEVFQSYIKLLGTLDTADVYIWFSGVLWSIIGGRLPVPFCGFQGLARHRWTAKGDGQFTQKAYDVGFFSDLETGQPIESIINPVTKEENQVYHNKYGGFEKEHRFENFIKTGEDGKNVADKLNWTTAGNQITMTERSSGEVPTKLPPEKWPRETSGPINYYAGETSYSTQLDHLLDPNVRQADYSLAWSGLAPWEPWLLMDGAAGFTQWRASGIKLRSYKEAPRHVLDFVEKDQPNYFDPEDPWDGYLSNTDRFKKDRSPAQ